MSRYAGVLRDADGLQHLLGLLAAIPPAAQPGQGQPAATGGGAGDGGTIGAAAGSSGPADGTGVADGTGPAGAATGGQPAPLDLPTVEATNLHTVSTLVAAAALARAESRGCHRRSDYPRARPGAGQRITIRAQAGQLDLRTGDQPAEWIGVPA